MGGPYYTDKAQVSWVFGEATMVDCKAEGELRGSGEGIQEGGSQEGSCQEGDYQDGYPQEGRSKKKVTLQVDEPETSEQEVVDTNTDGGGCGQHNTGYDAETDNEEDPTANDSDEEDLQVEVEEVDGVEYLVNTQNGEVYDYAVYQESYGRW